MGILKTKKQKKEEGEEKKLGKSASPNITTLKGVSLKGFIIRPWISEKAQGLREMNKYTFLVDVNTNKKQIKEEVEKMYNVNITDISTTKIPGKKKRYRNIQSKKGRGMKKATVSVKEGQKIEAI